MKEEFTIFTQVKETFSHFKITKKKLFIILGIITALMLGVGVYVALVPFNFVNGGFRTFVGLLLAVWCVPLVFRDGYVMKDGKCGAYKRKSSNHRKRRVPLPDSKVLDSGKLKEV